jgi:hypothetical protein
LFSEIGIFDIKFELYYKLSPSNMGVDYHATPWKFEAKIGIRDLKSMALNPTPTRMKTLAYDIKSEQFSISDENGGKKLV